MSKTKAIKKARVFVPITKIDEATQTVYGRITQEVEDKAGETLDYATSAPLFKAWSESIEKASGGKSYGNVRVMHQLKAAGKLTEIIFLDDELAIDVAAKIVDADEWQKCLEGVYTGFSIGGGLVKRWKEDGAVKITVDPSEVSIVDNPCVGTAVFTMMKADGSEAEVSFKIYTPTNSEVAAKAAELAGEGGDFVEKLEDARAALIAERVSKAMGDDEIEDEVEDTETPPETPEIQAGGAEGEDVDADTPAAEAEGAEKTTPAGVRQVWADSSGKAHETKKAAVAAQRTIDAAADPVEAALKAARGEIPAPETAESATFVVDGAADVFAAFKTVKALFDEKVVRKGIYDLRNFSGILENLSWLTDNSICEAGWERDGSKIPEALMGHLRALGATFVEMAKEEIAEMVAGLEATGVRVQIFEGAEGDSSFKVATEEEVSKAEGTDEDVSTLTLSVPGEIVEKVGARNSKADAARIQKAHDATVEAGAACACGEGEAAAKAAGGLSYEALVADNAAKAAQIDKAVGGILALGEDMKALQAEVETLKASPTSGAPRLSVVGKGADSVLHSTTPALPGVDPTLSPQDQIAKMIEVFGQDAVIEASIKAAQRQPHAVGQGGGA